VQRGEDALKAQRNRDHREEVGRDLAVLRAGKDTTAADLRKLDARLKRVPHPELENAEDFGHRSRLADDITRALLVITAKDFRDRFEQLLAAGQVAEAGKLLADRPDAAGGLAADFPRRALEVVERECRAYLMLGRWRDAAAALARLDGDARVVKLLGDQGLQKVNGLRAELRAAEDRALYEEVRRFRDLRRANAYLEATHTPQRMKAEVHAFRDYLIDKDRELKLTFKVTQIEWGNVWGGTTRYKVYLDDVLVLDGEHDAKKNTTSKGEASAEVRYRLSDKVHWRVIATHSGLWDSSLGESNWDCEVRELQKEFATLNGTRPPTVLYFGLDGVPQEPRLPPYRGG
jgi:hypothetical protein